MKPKSLPILIIILLYAYSSCVAQAKYPTGKFLMQTQDFDNDQNNISEMLVQITTEGILAVLFANNRNPLPLARLEAFGENIHLEFTPLLDNLSGIFNVDYLPKNCMRLKNEQSELLFSPFIEAEIETNNKAKDINGKWLMKDEDEELTLNFQLPYTLSIETSKDYEQESGDVFWVSQANDEDVTVTSTLFFNPLSGTLKQVEIINNELHFDYNDKHYVLQSYE